MKPPEELTIPLGPNVVFTKSAMAIAPMKDACQQIKGQQCQFGGQFCSQTCKGITDDVISTYQSGIFSFFLDSSRVQDALRKVRGYLQQTVNDQHASNR